MNIPKIQANPISFKYKSILKSYWLEDMMPSVKFDMGGNQLTKKNCTLGHMLAHSKKGKSELANYMLETKGYNMMKSNKPFSQFFTQEGFDTYCKQFEKVDLPGFDGLNYIGMITKTAKRLLRERK